MCKNLCKKQTKQVVNTQKAERLTRYLPSKVAHETMTNGCKRLQKKAIIGHKNSNEQKVKKSFELLDRK